MLLLMRTYYLMQACSPQDVPVWFYVLSRDPASTEYGAASVQRRVVLALLKAK